MSKQPDFQGWNVFDDDEEEELQQRYYGGTKDTVLFCIDASESMHEPHEDEDEGVTKSHLQAALEAALQVAKRKIMSGPSDHIGIMLYNTEDKSSEDLKPHTYVLQQIAPLSIQSIRELNNIVQDALDDPETLRSSFPPNTGDRVPLGDVFSSCNWVMRYNAAKTGTKRVFLITNEDDPHPKNSILMGTAKVNLQDLRQVGVEVLPFFIGSDEKPFDVNKFYTQVLQREDAPDTEAVPTIPDVVTGFQDLIDKLQVRESAKRAQFSIPLHLGKGFTIGVKGYGLITEQRKTTSRKMANRGESYEELVAKTVYYDEELMIDAGKENIVYGMSLGAAPAPVKGGAPAAADAEDAGEEGGARKPAGAKPTRVTAVKSRVYFTKDEVKQFRTLGLEPGLKLLGFKDRTELRFEDNVKHSLFIYPNESAFNGSTRTFAALLQVLAKKDKFALVVGITRANSSPAFYAMIPQEEVLDKAGAQIVPPGFHLIVLPFADDIRSATVESAEAASDELKDAARALINKLNVKSGYDPKKFPNPALKLHYEQLQALAFDEPYDFEKFDDPSAPPYDVIHQRAGPLLVKWKEALDEDPASEKIKVTATGGTKRKAAASTVGDVADAEIRSRADAGTLDKLKVDQLKAFLRSKGQSVSGKKADLTDRIQQWVDDHP
ncbi:Ku DNA-binding complex, Ku70 subunit [Auricularia subglabra TFB-10046 SS5]|nr:Ku DNA-binding complex, Ku70 subunit [Auricularia subglabra TFB-10046 SS5]